MDAHIILIGDICPEWGFPDQFKTGKAEEVFHDLLPILKGADYVVANLESPATDKTKKQAKNSICLKARPNDIKVLKEAGINAVALANNHILDYGVDGFNDTILNLDSNGISHFGAASIDRANEPLFVDINGYKIGFLAFVEREFNCAIDYGYGAALWDDLDSPIIIREAKSKCDYLIVQYHGGVEHYEFPSPHLQKKCRAMADAGADFIACQHSHCIGSHENWHGSEILYGQGNAIFGKGKSKKWNYGLLVDINIGENIDFNFIPIVAHNDGEYLASENESKEILSTLEKNSVNLSDSKFIKTQWEAFCKKHSAEYAPILFAWNKGMSKLNRITNGKMINLFTKKIARRNAMNLIRCDAHREVVQTILEKEFYNE